MKKASILIIHGLFEHKGRQEINASWFKELGINSYLMDIPGHGNEAKVLGDISSWDEIDNSVKSNYSHLSSSEIKIVFRHSFCGQVALYSILKGLIEPNFLILSAPTLGDNYPQFIKNLSKTISKISPALRIPSSVNKRNLSTDESVVKDYFDDPLVFRSLTARYAKEAIETQNFVNENIKNLKTPTILLHGENDKIVPISSGIELSKLENVKFVPVSNSKHEILNQDTRPFVLSEIHQWLKENKII